jgi:hypothetical protein
MSTPCKGSIKDLKNLLRERTESDFKDSPDQTLGYYGKNHSRKMDTIKSNVRT